MSKKYHILIFFASGVALLSSIFAPVIFKYDESSQYFIELLLADSDSIEFSDKQLQHVASFIEAQNNIISGCLSLVSAFSIFIIIVNIVFMLTSSKAEATKSGWSK